MTVDRVNVNPMTNPGNTADAAVLDELTNILPRLRRAAEGDERDGVTADALDRLAAAGLYAACGPATLGGLHAASQRRAHELLAGANPDLWFVWFQHAAVVAKLARAADGELPARVLPELCSGRMRAGVAFSHLRTPRPTITAERDGSAWRLTGSQAWCTGWGLISTLLVGALTPDGDAIFGLVNADTAGLAPTERLRLAAMNGTSTVGLTLDGVRLEAGEVTVQMGYDDWLAADRTRNANVQPATVGIALAANELLAERDPETSAQLGAKVAAARDDAYRLLDEIPLTERVADRLALRARLLVLGVQSAAALLAARGGAGMGQADPAQRLVRAAAFQLVHAQDLDVRAQTLSALRATG